MYDWVAILVRGRIAYMERANSIDHADLENIYIETVDKNLVPQR